MIKQHGLDPIIQPSDVSETLPFPMEPQIAVMYLALKKALHAGNQRKVIAQANPEHPLLCREKGEPSHILAADTIVVFDDKIIGKPKNREEAFQTLRMLRKNPHHVITGVCVIDLQTGSKTCFYDTSTVYFTDYSDEELQAYVNTREPYDKAGGYAIQGTFGKYVDHIEGDRDNIVGLIDETACLFSGNSRQVGLAPGHFRQVGLAPGNFRQQKTASSFRLFRPTAAMQFFFFRFLFRQDFASRSISFQALTPRPITISGSHTQANHNFSLSHPGQSQSHALTSARRSTRPTVPSDHHYDKP